MEEKDLKLTKETEAVCNEENTCGQTAGENETVHKNEESKKEQTQDVSVSSYYNALKQNSESNTNNSVKKKYPIETREIVFTFVSLAASILFVILAFWGGFNSGFTLSFYALFALLSWFCYKKGTKINALGVACGILAVLLAGVFSISINATVNLLLLALIAFLTTVWLHSLSGKEIPFSDGALGGFIMRGLGRALTKIDVAASSVFSAGKKLSGVGKVLIGFACAVPVLLLIIPLLTSADDAFAGLINNVGEDFGKRILQIILGIGLTFPVLAYGFSIKNDELTVTKQENSKKLDNAYIISFLGIISAVYVAYLFSQTAYFFSAFSGILPAGYHFTPAEYARRGFSEMCTIAFINFGLVYAALAVHKKEAKSSFGVKAICCFIIIFTLLLISTAMAKMVLYIGEFGMTRLRILTSVFMLVLAVVFICLFIRCLSKKVPVMRIALIVSTCAMLVLGFGNVDTFIAEYNYNAYKQGYLENIDVDTINELGLSGVPTLKKIYDNEKEYRSAAKEKLEYQAKLNLDSESAIGQTGRLEWYVKTKRELGDWNYTKAEAIGILEDMFLGKYLD